MAITLIHGLKKFDQSFVISRTSPLIFYDMQFIYAMEIEKQQLFYCFTIWALQAAEKAEKFLFLGPFIFQH